MLSVIIITKNEEANLRRCLESITWVDEIIILDSGSTDNTVKIAKEFTENVIINDDWLGYGVQKQRVLNATKGDWVLNLDADEYVTVELKQSIQQAIASNEADAYRVPICMNFYGTALPHSSSPKRHVRLFKRAGANYSDDIVHEKIVLPADTRYKQLTTPIMHHSFQDICHAIYKMNRYSSYSARIRLQTKSTPSITRILLSSFWMFFRCYILQRGFLDGKGGLLMAVFNAQGTFYRGMKQIYPDNSFSQGLQTKEGASGHG